MNARILIAAFAAAIAGSTASIADAHLLRPDCNAKLSAKQELACARRNLNHANFTIQWARQRLSEVQRRLHQQSPSKAAASLVMYPLNYDPVQQAELQAQLGTLHSMIRNHAWIYRTMKARVAEAQRRLVSYMPPINDWLTAVGFVQRYYPGSSWWLTSCSASEGGHGIWVWNGGAPYGSPYHGSGAGGWMQFMEGTFWGNFHSAERDLLARGIHVPFSVASYTSPLGQALAAGWAYGHDRPPGKWTGSGC